MFSVNRILVVGNLAKDVELFNDGKIAKATLAVNRYMGKNEDGTVKTDVSFIKAVFFNGKVNAVKELKKGDSLGIEGYLKNSSYEKDGTKYNYYELITEDIILGQKISNKNSVEVAGNLVADPEFITTGKVPATRVRLACNRYAGKDESGNPKTDVTFITVVMFGKQAEVIAEHSKKGDTIYVNGVLSVKTYEKDGKKLVDTKILSNKVQFISSKKAVDAVPDNNEQVTDDEIPF
jgi:single-strand DNA-binding protein